MLFNWLKRLHEKRTSSRRPDRRRTVLGLENLEERCVPSGVPPTMTQITNASAYPFSAVVQVESIFPLTPVGQCECGTGAMVNANHVLTAGHMVYNDALGGWATQVLVYAGMTSANNFVAEATASYGCTFTSYINDSNAWAQAHKDGSNNHDPGDGDIGVLELTTSIGNKTGWFGLGVDEGKLDDGEKLNTIGYPADGNKADPNRWDNSYNQYLQYGQITKTVIGDSGAFWAYQYAQSNIHSERGQSGSPVYAYFPSSGQNTIYGVIESGDSSVGYAERINSGVFGALEPAIANGLASLAGGSVKKMVNQAPMLTSSTVLSTSKYSSTVGQAMIFYATVSVSGPIAPTGTVTFYDGATKLGTANLQPPSGGAAYATFKTSALGVGSHTITAVYSGDATYAGSDTTALTATVYSLSSSTILGDGSPASFTSTAGLAVTFTANVYGTGSTRPTGTVTFYDGATKLGAANLQADIWGPAYATFSTSTLGVGSHTITAVYSGDGNYPGSESQAVTETVTGPPVYVASEIPGAGVWRYDSVTGWRQLTPADASQVAVDAKGDVAVEIAGAGVWRFEDSTGWRQLTAADASQVHIDGNGDVAVEISGAGVWRFEDAIGWQQLTSADASQVSIAGAGVVAVEIAGAGVWRFEDAAGWRQLTAADASQMAVDANGDVAVEIAGAGVWRFEDSAGWAQLTTTDASQVSIAGAGVVAAELPGAGVWRFEDAAGWEQLSASNASQVAVDANGDVAADLNGAGVWLFQDGLSWGQLTAANALEIGLGG